MFAAVGLSEAAAIGGTAAAGLGAAEIGATALTAADFSLGLGEALAVTSSLPSLSTIGTVASIAGTGIEAISGGKKAAYEEAVAKNQAAALRIKAGEEAAAGQRQQIMQERRTGLVTSRARALAASSGTDATSPTQIDIEEEIGRQGNYNAQSALYEGLARRDASNYQAEIDLFKAQRIRQAAPLAMAGTILSGIGGLAKPRARSSGSGFFGFDT